ncbi:MAG: hypothetical protein HY781_06355 [Chloroflexi bacterium]|nr:hypothetical protein [Chloroflexota bacterium]
MDSFAFLPGDETGDSRPLARFLPPIPGGVGAAFLTRHAVSGEWVLDPFGAAPSLAVEMARFGKNVLVAVNNPVTRFLLELAATPPSVEELRAALSDLAATRKGEERLETHLQSLYLTDCAKCQRQIPAEAFIWEKGASVPSGRLYQCPCGESGEFPASEADQARALRIAATDSLHRARALERVAAPDDPDRPYAEQALECYLPRAVYALIAIVNKLDSFSLDLPKERRRALLALVLAACDEASALWPHPTERPRPKQLAVPPRFLEKNVWLALERAVERWGSETPIQTSDWAAAFPAGGSQPVQSGTGGVYVFEGPVRLLVPALKAIPPAAVVSALPRPNQAFWSLSALWAGWLWGRAATAQFKSVLRRRRYDWNWHTAALYAALKNISPHLPLNTPLFALLPEPEPAFLSAALLAAAGAGFDLDGLALRTRGDAVQIAWRRRAFLRDEKEPPEIDPQAVKDALEACLGSRGEPVPYLYLHAAGLAAMAADRSLRWREEAVSALNAPLQAALAGPGFFHHSESDNAETGLWGLSDWDAIETLPDKVEIALIHYLQKNPGAAFRDLEIALNAEFPGLLTPSLGMLRAVLASYAEENDGGWTLRPEDAPNARRADLDSAVQTLTTLAPQLGYAAASEQKPWRILRWLEAGQTAYAFHIVASAVAGKILRAASEPPERCVLVLPGGRAGLLAYKLDRDPDLRLRAERWRVLKFRQLRRIAGLPGLTRERWEKELSSDPLEPPEQMKLF